MIGGVGQRMLGSVAKRTAGEFFSAVERHLAGAAVASGVAGGDLAPVTPGVVGASGGDAQPSGRVYEREVREHTTTRPWVMLASFGMGAGVALTGVAIGWLFGRAAAEPQGPPDAAGSEAATSGGGQVAASVR